MPRASLAFFLAAIAAGDIAAQQPRASFEISGTVVEHRTKAPLSSVMVSVTPVANARGERLSIVSAADGRFQFTGLTPGKYALTAERRGQQAQQFHAHGQFSTAIAVGPEMESQHIVFSLFASGRIAGTVVDEDGDPVVSAQVYLLRKHISDGKSRVTMQLQQITTVSGAFHFGHLAPGTYYLAVTAHPWYAGGHEVVTRRDANGRMFHEAVAPQPFLDRVYPVTYSGDATEPAGAQAIDLPEGGSVEVPINLHAVPAIHVTIPGPEIAPRSESSGQSPPQPVESAAVTAIGLGGIEIRLPGVFVRNPVGDGRPEQEITMAPGTYRVRHAVTEANGQPGTADETINVAQSGAALVSQTSATTSVSGHVSYTGTTPPGMVALQMIGEHHRAGTLVQADGSFAFGQPVLPGRYRLRLGGETPLAVQTVSEGKHTTAGDLLLIPENPPNALDISVMTVPMASTSLQGTAVREGKPVAGAMVLLLPEHTSEDVPIGRDQSDSDGTFAIPNVPAGRYTLLAFECDQEDDSCGIEYRNPAEMKPYLAQGNAVTLPAPGKQPMEVTVIAAPK